MNEKELDLVLGAAEKAAEQLLEDWDLSDFFEPLVYDAFIDGAYFAFNIVEKEKHSSDLIESAQLLHEFFNDDAKVALWLSTPNPHLGNAVPISFFLVGRGHKVLKFIRTMKEENQ